MHFKRESKLTQCNENILGTQNFRNGNITRERFQKFNNNVDITENRYQVQFPYEGNHEILENEFKYTEHLKNLARKFQYDKNLFSFFSQRFRKYKIKN